LIDVENTEDLLIEFDENTYDL